MTSYICLWFYVVLARQFWCNTFLLPYWLAVVMLCVSESLFSSIQHLVRSVGQSHGCRCVFVHQACVTMTIASYQVAVAEDELRHPCSTAGDEVFHNWFRSQARYHKSGRRDLKTWTRTIDELQTNENSSATRSAN